MGKIQVTIKNIDEDSFSELKAEAARRKLNVGAALSLAIGKWLSETGQKLKLTDWKTVKGGKKTRRLSEQADSVIYG
ncbi:MAG TPA: hypothetical protein VJI97_02995 [Candidatus Nanoarchaeia archaeon]|nr:hypothetical protein [Candidatus Nanoarchaeia archaeon]